MSDPIAHAWDGLPPRPRLQYERDPQKLVVAKRQGNGAGGDGIDESRPWPELDMALAQDDRAPPPEFDWEAIPPSWREWIKGTAEDCSAPIDFVAANLIGTAAAVIGNVRRVSPWPSWVQHPFLWFALVGPPSSMKTPSMDPFKVALMKIQDDAMATHPDTLRHWETQREEASAKLESWKKDVKTAVGMKTEPPKKPQEADLPPQPTPPRLVIVDATTEEAVNLLSRNHRGLVLMRSELSGWIGQLDRYGGAGADRAFYLESYDGGSHTVDRVKHNGAAVQVPYCSLSTIGGTQPDKLRAIFTGPDDGLAERFIYIWPDPVPPCRPNQKGFRGRTAYLLRAFQRLRSLEWDRDGAGTPVPKVIGVAEDGLNVLDQIRNESSEQGQNGLIACWRGKNPGRLLRLALVFELIEWAAKPDGTPEPEIVSLASTKRAADYVDYLNAMMLRALGELAFSNAQRHAAPVARMILSTRPSHLNERKLYQSAGFHDLRDNELRGEVFGELEEAGWVRRKRTATGGRPSNNWEINPLLLREC